MLITVTGDGQFGWQVSVTSPDGAVEFVPGPGLPPIGVGSARLFTGTNGDLGAELRLSTFDGTPLVNLTDLRYWTYDRINNGQQWPYIILNIDLNGDNTVDDLLFFEPAFQTPASGNPTLPDQGPPVLNTWQDWNALAGGWWSLNSIGGATPGTGVKPLSTYLAAAPTARIIASPSGLGGIRLVHGFASPGDVFDGNVDAFSIQTTSTGITTTYNFDPLVPVPPPPRPRLRVSFARPPLFVCNGTLPGVRTSRS
jgi:hypothetical protein